MLLGRSEHRSRCVCISALFSTAGTSGTPQLFSFTTCWFPPWRGPGAHKWHWKGYSRTCLAHYTCCWPLSPPEQIRASRKETPSGSSLHTHWGFAALPLQSCSSCASLPAKTDTANNTGKKFCVLCMHLGKRECLHAST